MKKIAILMLSLSLVLMLLASCGCSEHVDADKDGKCDNCSAEVEIECNGEHVDADKDSVCDICEEYFTTAPVETIVNVTYTLVDQDGGVLPGVKVYFYKGGASTAAYTATSGADGKLSLEMLTGAYSIDYVYEGFYQALTKTVNVMETTANVNLSFNNTTPNGTMSRPYPISIGDVNEYTLAVGEQSYFIVYRAVDLLADVTGAGLKVTYADAVYESDANGKINFELVGEDTNSSALILIENTGSSEAAISILVNSRLGTQGNPIVIETLEESITAEGIVKEQVVYYRYVATKTGKLTLTTTGDGAFASMQNARNSVVASTSEAGGGVITLEVKEGDEILINVSSFLELEEGATTDVIFSLAISESEGAIETSKDVVETPMAGLDI